ncbi:ammonium transporter 3 member 1-like [Apium graveolens]|uniref:ammonium transporter 3 member 1-like n=1 Tax=Apium graveolens TaxID=4045 RepID=UPI003D78CBE1
MWISEETGSLLVRMNIKDWMMFVPLWLTFSYTVGAFSLWGGGFLFQWGVIDYTVGFIIYLSSGIAGLTAAYWIGPRSKADMERFPPNNIMLMLAGAGLLWIGWAGFNGGGPYTANIDSSMAILNTNTYATTSLLVWTLLDVIFFKKPFLIGAVQGMITGLICITPGAEWDAMYTTQVTQQNKNYHSGIIKLASCGSYRMQDILEKPQPLSPRALIVDRLGM